MNALVTGASGFLGKPLVMKLMETCELVVTFQRDGQFVTWFGLDGSARQVSVRGDITNIECLERVLSQYEIDTVFHLAAQTDVRIAHAEPLSTWDSNVRGTWNLMEACRTQKVKRIVVASTDKAYGWTPPPYKESDPLRASGIYETSKTCGDLIAQSYSMTYDMSVAITRCGNFYGPGRLNFATLIPGTIKSILEGKRPVLRTDGTFRRDFMHISDGVSAYMALSKYDVRGAFNFGTGEPHMVIDVVNLICELMDWKGGVEIIPTAKGEIVDQYLDTARAVSELGWSPKVKFVDGLRNTIEWYRGWFRKDMP